MNTAMCESPATTVSRGWRLRAGSILFLGLFVAGCGREEASNAAPVVKKSPLVSVEPVTAGEMSRIIELTAEVAPLESIQVSSTVEGPICYFPWREGDQVEAGQKLVEIDREVYRAEVNAAEAALAVAQAKLDDLNAGTRPEEVDKARESVREAEQSAEYERSDAGRIAQLVETGALAGEEREKARVKLTAAEAKLQAARRQLDMLEAGFTRTVIAVQDAVVKESAAKLELARAKLQETILAAPFVGTVTKVYVRQGDMAAIKAPLLEMADLSSLVVRCAVPEVNSAEVRAGMKAQVTLDAAPGEVFQGEVARVYPELDPRMRTRTIELSLQDNGKMAPGMFGRARILLETVPDAVSVPVQAVISTPAGQQVAFVAVEGKALQRKVETGLEAGGRVQIISGLKPGEQVIVSGQEKLKDGAEVRLPQPKAKPGGGPGSVGGAEKPKPGGDQPK